MKLSKVIAVLVLAMPITSVHAVEIDFINFSNNSILFDAFSNQLYATVGSTAGPAYGNTITRINPYDRTVNGAVFIGSEPGTMAISDNGHYIYTSLDGANAIRRYDTQSHTAGLQFSLGVDTHTGPYKAEDIEVMPGNQNTVAVSLRNRGFSPRHEGVAIFDDGNMRPVTTPGHTGSNRIEFSDDPSRLYGYNNETTEFGFRTMNVDTDGVTVDTVVRNLVSGFGTDIEFENGLVYSTTGAAIDPEAGLLMGTFAGSGIIEADSDLGLMFMLEDSYTATRSLKIFDLETFVLLDTIAIDGVLGTATDLIRYSDDNLAFRTDDQIFFIDTGVVPIPAAVWLFGSGLIAMVGFARRKTS